jgi:hypothetical protein
MIAFPIVEESESIQFVITPSSGDLDYDFQDGHSFRTTISSNTELQFPTLNGGSLPTNRTYSYQITVIFSADADLSFVSGYFNGDEVLATISGLTGETYVLYMFAQEFNGKIDVNVIQQE